MKKIRIGTRDSKLALWQADSVRNELLKRGFDAELVPMKSTGDLNTDVHIRRLSGVGLFTRELDAALLHNHIDVAVHSLKDYPTVPPDGVRLAATLKRHNPADVLLLKGDLTTPDTEKHTIATGSIRRTAFWLNRFPHHEVVNLRGNVITRLQKLENNAWTGAIFALAGLERIDAKPTHIRAEILDWMVPAPAQGVIGITCRKDDTAIVSTCAELTDQESWITSAIERGFLNYLEGGCAAPIGAYATLQNNADIQFRASVLTPDGSKRADLRKLDFLPSYTPEDFGAHFAEMILQSGADEIMHLIRHDNV